jgi:hypothetical protein
VEEIVSVVAIAVVDARETDPAPAIPESEESGVPAD